MRLFQKLSSSILFFLLVASPLYASGDPPTFSLDDSTLSYTEDQFPYPQIDAAVTVSDPENDWDGGTITIQITANSEALDRIEIRDFGGSSVELTVESLDLLADGTKVADLNRSSAQGGDDLVVTLNANATNAIVLAILQQVRFYTASNEPSSAARTVTVALVDGESETVNDSRTVSVTPRNDNPFVSVNAADPSFTAGDPAVQVFSSTSGSAAETSQKIIAMEITVTNVYDGSAEKLIFEGASINLVDGFRSGNISVSVSGREATVRFDPVDFDSTDMSNLVTAIKYQHTGSAPTGADRAIAIDHIQDNGGTANGGTDTSVFSFPSLVSVAGTPPVNPGLTRKAISGEVTDGTSSKQGVIVYVPKLGAAVTNEFGVYTLPGAVKGVEYTAYFQTDDMNFSDPEQGAAVTTEQFRSTEGSFVNISGYNCPVFDGRSRLTTIADRSSQIFRITRRKARKLNGALKKRSLKLLNTEFANFITASRAMPVTPVQCPEESYGAYYCPALDVAADKQDIITALIDLRDAALLVTKRLKSTLGLSKAAATRARKNIRQKFQEAKEAVEDYPDSGFDCSNVA